MVEGKNPLSGPVGGVRLAKGRSASFAPPSTGDALPRRGGDWQTGEESEPSTFLPDPRRTPTMKTLAGDRDRGPVGRCVPTALCRGPDPRPSWSGRRPSWRASRTPTADSRGKPGQASSLGSTSSAVRTLGFVGRVDPRRGEVHRLRQVVRRLDHRRLRTQTPGGKPDVGHHRHPADGGGGAQARRRPRMPRGRSATSRRTPRPSKRSGLPSPAWRRSRPPRPTSPAGSSRSRKARTPTAPSAPGSASLARPARR